MGVMEFLRDVGKHLTLNYMLTKESVKSRMETGISFTEFSYQLIQGYDFYWLHKNHGCKLQMGGSDQWGNMTAGAELIRRKAGGEAFAMTAPLIAKADGTKFGKTESGTIWLNPDWTSPYKFYQFWINAADDEAKNYLKRFTLLEKPEIEGLIEEHDNAPHLRTVQKALAKDVTTRVHSQSDYENAIRTSEILFGKSTKETLLELDERSLREVFEGVPHFNISMDEISQGINILDFLAEKTSILPSKAEARRALNEKSISINKEKIESLDAEVNQNHLLRDKLILVQRGKKKYFLVEIIV
jgi:tyrosyl-tRNA synthetase